MHFLLVGLNYKTAPVEAREALAFPSGEAGDFAVQLKCDAGLAEVIVLSTCNRTEVYAAAKDENALHIIVSRLAAQAGRVSFPNNTLYMATDTRAIKHLFTVAAGLDSLVVGEPQILGQVRTAHEEALQGGSAGGYLGQLFRRAIEVGKRVRTETGVGAGAASISYAAVELARKIFGNLHDKAALLVGAGEMAELAARNLRAHGVAQVHVANRTRERAVVLATEFGGQAHNLSELDVLLGKVDICITSTGAQEPIIKRDLVRQSLRQRRGRPLFIIDIAVPRNVDPAVHRLDGVFVYNIDDLQAVVESNLALRREQAAQVEEIVQQETKRLATWLQEQEAAPLVIELRRRADRLIAGELQRITRRCPGLAPEDKAAVQAGLESLANKLLHAPTVGLRVAAGTGSGALDEAASLLGLSMGGENLNGHSRGSKNSGRARCES